MKRLHPILLFLWLMISAFSIQAQEEKQQLKSSKAFLSIAYQDLKGEAIRPSLSKQLEKSYAAMGDKTVVTSILFRDFVLGRGPSQPAAILEDTGYLRLLQMCPKVCANRNADPYMIGLANYLSKMAKDSGDLVERHFRFLEWQKVNMPHAPFGLNEAPEGKSEKEEMEWGMVYCANWMKTKPDEYLKALAMFSQTFHEWKITNERGLFKDYIRALTSRLGVPMQENSCYFEAHESDNKENTLPDPEFMRKNPGQFIKEMYEALLIRYPTENEIQFLTKYINNHPDISPGLIYYALMTSKEYSFY